MIHFIDTPDKQFSILEKKYISLQKGRIPLPINAQQLWAQHKYSIMARDIASYKKIGAWVTTKSGANNISEVSLELTSLLMRTTKSKTY